jgi:Zn-dependent protease with chaperone function
MVKKGILDSCLLSCVPIRFTGCPKKLCKCSTPFYFLSGFSLLFLWLFPNYPRSHLFLLSLAYFCLLLLTFAYFCLLLLTFAYFCLLCLLLLTLAYFCLLLLTFAYSCLLLLTFAYFCLLLLTFSCSILELFSRSRTEFDFQSCYHSIVQGLVLIVNLWSTLAVYIEQGTLSIEREKSK